MIQVKTFEAWHLDRDTYFTKDGQTIDAAINAFLETVTFVSMTSAAPSPNTLTVTIAYQN